jgi:hypothetical protein
MGETMTLAPSDLSTLGTIAGLMIPADAKLRVPGADDPLILADIARSVGRDLHLVREALKSFSAGQKTKTDINDWYRSGAVPTVTLGRLVLAAYYRDDRVLLALGHEARAPFPKGYEVEQGDWSLLEAVKHRPAFWRDDRKGK